MMPRIKTGMARGGGRSERYQADDGITAYGINAFGLVPWTKALYVFVVAGFDRLAPPVADSPLISVRGSENQFLGGRFLSYNF